jgi:hypothetical protein
LKADPEKGAGNEGQWTGGLPEKSHWGIQYTGSASARDALVALTQPGKDKSAALPEKPFRDQTEQFVEKAFTFPTAAGVPPRPSVPDSNALSPFRLILSSTLEYLSKKWGD